MVVDRLIRFEHRSFVLIADQLVLQIVFEVVVVVVVLLLDLFRLSKRTGVPH